MLILIRTMSLVLSDNKENKEKDGEKVRFISKINSFEIDPVNLNNSYITNNLKLVIHDHR